MYKLADFSDFVYQEVTVFSQQDWSDMQLYEADLKIRRDFGGDIPETPLKLVY